MQSRPWVVVIAMLALMIGDRAASIATAQTIPAGAILNVRTTESIYAESAGPGQRLNAIVDDPVMVNGRVVVPRGARATLEVARVDRSSNLKGRDRIFFKVNSLHVNGRTYPVATSYAESRGPSEGKRARNKIIGGAGVGAVVGGLLGGGTGAAVGATAGGATGAAVAGSGKTHLSVPAETRLQFWFSSPTRIR